MMKHTAPIEGRFGPHKRKRSEGSRTTYRRLRIGRLMIEERSDEVQQASNQAATSKDQAIADCQTLPKQLLTSVTAKCFPQR